MTQDYVSKTIQNFIKKPNQKLPSLKNFRNNIKLTGKPLSNMVHEERKKR